MNATQDAQERIDAEEYRELAYDLVRGYPANVLTCNTYSSGSEKRMSIILADRRCPTEYANEGEYLTCVDFAIDGGGEFHVCEGYGTERGYDVTEFVEGYQEFEEAFNAAHTLVQEGSDEQG